MSRLGILFAAATVVAALSALTSANAQSADLYLPQGPAPCGGGVAPGYYGSGYYGPGYNGPGYYGAALPCGSGGAYAPPAYYGPPPYPASAYGNCGCRSGVVQETAIVAPLAPVAPLPPIAAAPVGCSPCGVGAPIAPYVPYAPYAGVAYGGQDRGAAFAACAARFRTFDPGTGTYISFSGVRVICPYLGY